MKKENIETRLRAIYTSSKYHKLNEKQKHSIKLFLDKFDGQPDNDPNLLNKVKRFEFLHKHPAVDRLDQITVAFVADSFHHVRNIR